MVAADHLDKVRLLRAFDVLLLLAAAGALWLLARQAFGPNVLLPYSAGLAVMLWPGFMVRATTVSNAALEVLVTLLFLAALWRADSRRDRRALAGAGALLGLVLLTKLTLLYLVPLLAWALVRELRRPEASRAAVAVAALLPVLMLAPWVASNIDRYGTITANEQARELQVPFLHASEPDFGAGDLAGKAPGLLDGFLPQEWDEREGLPAITAITTLLKLALFGAPLALLALEPARLRSREFALLVIPALLAALTIAATLLLADWDLFLARYLYPALPPLALFAAIAWRRLLRSERTAVIASAAVSAAVAALWVDAALAFYFTDLGDNLGFD
jgi:hypothetical protein